MSYTQEDAFNEYSGEEWREAVEWREVIEEVEAIEQREEWFFSMRSMRASQLPRCQSE